MTSLLSLRGRSPKQSHVTSKEIIASKHEIATSGYALLAMTKQDYYETSH